jgi:ParB/RepB/Spo0J family partition protein
MAEDRIVHIPVNTIGESYGRFRLIHPEREVAVLESVRQFGQILPVVVVVGLEPHIYELVDGFKRLRACRRLGAKTIQARVLSIGVRPAKAAILQLNWKARSVREIEEAMIVQSLYREDMLRQVDIGFLLGRHKSWVCRRISLVEKLCDKVLDHLKLGLIKVGHGRELSRLKPRKQEEALVPILKHRLSCRETEQLVAILLKRPTWEHERILYLPLEILDDRSPPHPSREMKGIRPDEPSLEQKLREFEKRCRCLVLELAARDFDPLSPQEQEMLLSVTESVRIALDRMRSLYALDLQGDKS